MIPLSRFTFNSETCINISHWLLINLFYSMIKFLERYIKISGNRPYIVSLHKFAGWFPRKKAVSELHPGIGEGKRGSTPALFVIASDVWYIYVGKARLQQSAACLYHWAINRHGHSEAVLPNFRNYWKILDFYKVIEYGLRLNYSSNFQNWIELNVYPCGTLVRLVRKRQNITH